MINSTLKNANILIVDDQQQNIDVLTGLLEMTGYNNYATTTDSRKVVDLFTSFKPNLILLDLMMPHLNGFQVIEQLKPLIPAGTFFPILVLTADIKTETKQQALANGATDFLTKPFDLIEVELRIRNLLNTQQLHQQLENQNLILDKKVKERTAILEQTNIELTIAKDKAEESDRLKSAFLTNMSHEIRTPMNGILSFSDLLKDAEIKIEKKQKFINIIEKSARRLLNTIDDIMDMSTIHSGLMVVSISEVNINSQMEELYDSFKPEAEKKGIQLTVNNTLTKDQAFIKSDKIKVNSILSNLIKNAIKFTDYGAIEINCSQQNNHINFFVKDTGIGIPKDRQPFVFDHFVQADIEDKAVKEGSGLGLTISKAYTEMLGGKLWLESEDGEGSTFYFTIPHTTEGKEPLNIENPTKATDYAIKIKKLKILIVEDDTTSELLLTAILDEINPELLYAETGVEAIKACRANPDIDLILMDIKMPEMNGYEATQQIRQFNENVILIGQSANGHSADGERALNSGCNSYISKPIIKGDLMELIYQYFT
jgi:signal transduction histidine kinase